MITPLENRPKRKETEEWEIGKERDTVNAVNKLT